MTPRTPSESAPTHGLSAIRESFSDVFVSEENDQADDDNDDDAFADDDIKLVKASGNHAKLSDVNTDVNDDDVSEPSVALIKGSENTSTLSRRRKESHV